MASICSDTFIDASSAPMPAPTRPVMIGPITWITEYTRVEGNIDFAPNRLRLYRASSEITTPMAAPASATRGKDFDPTSSSWRISSRHSYGGVTPARKTCHAKIPKLPNHSKNPVNTPAINSNGDGPRTVSPSGSSVFPSIAFASGALNGSARDRLRHAYRADASGRSTSGVHYRKTQGKHSVPHRPARNSCPFETRPSRQSDWDTIRKPPSWCLHRGQ